MAPSEPTHVEVERKFVVDDARRLDLSTVSGVDWVREVPAVELAAVYYDTADLRLGRMGVELRRRSGGHDAGWHLKVPVKAEEKIEIRAPLDDGDAEVPDRLAEAVLGLAGGSPLLPAATVDTRRRESELVASGGRTLAVVALDEVEAQRLIPTPARAIQWHEVEVELVDGPPKVMKRVARRLGESGAEPAPWPSKVSRVLDLPDPGQGTGSSSSSPTTAGDVVLAYVRRHVTALLLGDVAVRARQPEGIHDMRVATRRLRSTLATFRPFLDGPRWEAARGELKWIGRLLGGVRDLDVLEERLLVEIDDQEPLLVIGPVRARTRRELRAQRRDALETLDDALHSARHLALLDELSSLAAEPPLRKQAARKPARTVEQVDKAVRRVERAMTQAARAAGAHERDPDLHEIRKTAKRARYAAEAVRPVRGKRARRLARTMEDVQEVLGEHQDAVTARPVLRDLGVRAYLAGENGFTFGLLSRAEEVNADDARRRYRKLRPRLRQARSRFS